MNAPLIDASRCAHDDLRYSPDPIGDGVLVACLCCGWSRHAEVTAVPVDASAVDGDELLAPFPWFGGKRTIAARAWAAFGRPAHYIEPFAGSLAVLLARPDAPRIETVNDLDAHLANFWRAVAADPDTVARHADWPVSEPDLHARHQWLVSHIDDGFRAAVMADPEYFDARRAGWWVWGQSQWIGDGWCASLSPSRKLPAIDGRGSKGVHGTERRRPHIAGSDRGVHAKHPQITGNNPGRGVHSVPHQKPHLSTWGANGVDGGGVGRSIHALINIRARLRRLAMRLRRVRVCCGDWSRVVTPAVLAARGITAVFLDPPYSSTVRTPNIYAEDSGTPAASALAWCIAKGAEPSLRIALCGYEGEHDVLEREHGWSVQSWTSRGGYARTDEGKERRHKERLWLSPHCLKGDGPLFESTNGSET